MRSDHREKVKSLLASAPAGLWDGPPILLCMLDARRPIVMPLAAVPWRWPRQCVAAQCRAAFPQLVFELKIIKTTVTNCKPPRWPNRGGIAERIVHQRIGSGLD